MRGFLTGVGTMGIVLVVLLFTGPAVYDLFSGLFENADVGTIVGLIAVFLYGIFAANIGLVIAVLLGAVVNGIFDKRGSFNG